MIILFSRGFGIVISNVTESSVTLSWLTEAEAVSDLMIHKTGTRMEEREPGYLHSFTSTDLLPDTAYSYTLTSRVNEIITETYTGVFWTAPFENTPFKFAAYGDSRNNDEIHREITDRISNEAPNLVIHTGDMVYKDSREDEWLSFMDTIGNFKPAAFYSAIGNHEKEAVNYQKYLALPGNERYYSFRYGYLLFIVLNTNERFDKYSEQYKWLKKTLEEEKQAAYTVVFFHHPPYSCGPHGDHIFVKLILVPLFEKTGVDIVISGHDHGYQRIRVNEITYIVTAGGGASLYSIEEGKNLIGSSKEYHYLLMEYDGKKLKGSVKNLDNKVIDSFHVNALQ